MNVAVELFFDSTSERRLRELGQSLEAIYGDDHESELGVRPHLSLTVFPDGEPAFLRAELQDLANRAVPFRLELTSVESFPTSEGVLYLAPALSGSLADIHAAFHASLATQQELGHAYYRPGSWVPHCTVATGVPPNLQGAVLDACRAADVLREVWVHGISATAYRPRPARELYPFPLHPEKSVGM